jgi:uncharacterized membrane protein (UPF0136 family)
VAAERRRWRLWRRQVAAGGAAGAAHEIRAQRDGLAAGTGGGWPAAADGYLPYLVWPADAVPQYRGCARQSSWLQRNRITTDSWTRWKMAPAGSAHLDFTLAVLTAAGGTIGYVKARSVPSVSARFLVRPCCATGTTMASPRLFAAGGGPGDRRLLRRIWLPHQRERRRSSKSHALDGVQQSSTSPATWPGHPTPTPTPCPPAPSSAPPLQAGEGAQGQSAGLATSVLLTAAMGVRLAKTRKAMPAGLLAVVGAAASAYHYQGYRAWAG